MSKVLSMVIQIMAVAVPLTGYFIEACNREMIIRFAVAALFIGLLGTVPSVWATNAIHAEQGPAIISEHASTNTSYWKTYTSERYGFEMKYPQDLAVENEIPSAVIKGAVLRLLLVNRMYYDGTNLVEASLHIGVTPDEACRSRYLRSELKTSVEMQMIAGVSFSKVSSWEGAAGNRYDLITYSAPHAGNCYTIALFIHSVNIYVFYPQTVSKFDRAAVLRLFDQVISTFRFIK